MFLTNGNFHANFTFSIEFYQVAYEIHLEVDRNLEPLSFAGLMKEFYF